jgi:N4-(beta-N-acetylglucosaminyl)-L-asparaginase
MQRRDFIVKGGLGLGALAAGALAREEARAAGAVAAAEGGGPAPAPIVVSSGNGLKATERAMEILKGGGSSLDAVIAGVNRVEEDPDDITVGLGGLPNERGVVELDASCMHGPSARAGAVASLRNVKHPSRVARLVMEQTDHVLIVGEGALEFARAQGFPEENLLTEKARKIWLWWRQTHSDKDDWIPPPESEWAPEVKEYARTYGTIHCSAIDASGAVSAVTTTSGLAFKIPGRVGDSPIVGAGIYVDNDVGSCGSTGRGEEVILACGSHSVVENLRRGMSPLDAGLDVLRRILDRARRLPRLLKPDGTPDFNVNFYVLDRKGAYAGCALFSGSYFTVHDGKENRRLESAWLLKRKGPA